MNIDLALGLHVLGFLTARRGSPLTSETLADSFGTNPVVVRRVLGKLKEAGLVLSRRGAGGGSVLARDASEITLRDVYLAVAERPELLRRHPGEADGAAQVLAGYINRIYDEAEDALLARLQSVTIEQMDAEVRPEICAALARRGLDSAAPASQRAS